MTGVENLVVMHYQVMLDSAFFFFFGVASAFVQSCALLLKRAVRHAGDLHALLLGSIKLKMPAAQLMHKVLRPKRDYEI